MTAIYRNQANGFTLVELAIALMVIGLLIGGVLKGQELIENARITRTMHDIESYNGAVTIFRSTYTALPGDMRNPGIRVPNCSGLCATTGNGGGAIGTANHLANVSSILIEEQATVWLHLQNARLISNIDPNSTWTPTTISTASRPKTPLGGKFNITHYSSPPDSLALDGMQGHWFGFTLEGAPSNSLGGSALKHTVIARLDIKMDDGHPWRGSVLLGSVFCGTPATATEYDPNSMTLCSARAQSAF